MLSRANVGFELSDPDLFANAFAPDAVYELVSEVQVFGYRKLLYSGRADIRTIISDRLERARNADPETLSYDPASLRRYNRNSDSLIEIIDDDSARHISTWMVVMKTNVDIHTSAIGRYEDELVKRDGEWLTRNAGASNTASKTGCRRPELRSSEREASTPARSYPSTAERIRRDTGRSSRARRPGRAGNAAPSSAVPQRSSDGNAGTADRGASPRAFRRMASCPLAPFRASVEAKSSK